MSDAASLEPTQDTLDALARQPDDAPVYMLNLLRFTDGNPAEYMKYGAIAQPQIEKRGGTVLYMAPPVQPRDAVGWDAVAIVRYPSRSSFLEMLADPVYQAGTPHRRAGLERTVLYAFRETAAPPLGMATPDPSQPVKLSGGDEIFVLNLLRYKPDGGREDYMKYSAVVGPEIRTRGGGPVLLLTGELPLVSDEAWHTLALVRYPALASLMEMVGTDTWKQANVDRQRGLDATLAFPTQPRG